MRCRPLDERKLTADTTALAVALLVLAAEQFAILILAPRRTRRLVKSDARLIFDEEVRPAIAEEVGKVTDALAKAVASLSDDLHKHLSMLGEQVRGFAAAVPAVPSPQAVAAEVRDALMKAQAEAMQGRPDPMASLREVIRGELDAFAAKLDAADAAMPSPEDAARTLGNRGVDARLTFASQEEQFGAAVMKAAGPNGPLAVAAMEKARQVFPATYKLLVRQGPAGVPAFFQQAQAHGMLPALPGAAHDGGGSDALL